MSALEVRLTRSVSGNILAFDFVHGKKNANEPPPQPETAVQPDEPLPHALATVDEFAASAAAAASSHAPERVLKIIEHKVHKVEKRVGEGGKNEDELIVSNLRAFTIKVGVFDSRGEPITEPALALSASLLYENGFPVKPTSSSEPLLVGETDVVALQGVATLKLRITSLTSHRDKQRFRIQLAPQDQNVRAQEPNFLVVTEPMKSVTKLGREMKPAPSDQAPSAPAVNRRFCDLLDEQEAELKHFEDSQRQIQSEMDEIRSILKRKFGK